MLRTEFEYNEHNIVAYAHSSDSYGANGLVVKFVDDDGERIFPDLEDGELDEIRELATEILMELDTRELEF